MCGCQDSYWDDLIRKGREAEFEILQRQNVANSFTVPEGKYDFVYVGDDGVTRTILPSVKFDKPLNVTYAEQIELQDAMGVKRGYALIFGEK